MCWPIRRAPTSLADSCLPGRQNPLWFSQPDATWEHFPESDALGWGVWPGVETPFFSGGTFAAVIYPKNLSHHPWEQGQPFLCLHPSHQSRFGFFCKSLVIRLLFNEPSIDYLGLIFCILILICLLLGGGKYNIHLLYHHLWFDSRNYFKTKCLIIFFFRNIRSNTEISVQLKKERWSQYDSHIFVFMF